MAGDSLSGSDPALRNERPGGFPPAPENLFGPRCLAHVVPLRPGQRVLVVGTMPSLTQSLARRGATPVSVLGANPAEEGGGLAGQVWPEYWALGLPLRDASVDHAIVPDASGEWWQPHQLKQLTRVVAPGGTLLLGASNRVRYPWRTGAQTPAGGRRRLAAGGFAQPRAYGVRHGFHDPRFLVPLDDAGARQWFFDTYPPRGARHARVVAALARAPRTPVDLLFFPHLLFVAQRGGEPAC